MFKKRILKAAIALFATTATLHATSIDGMYTDTENTSEACDPRFVGEHYNAFAVKDGFYYGLEYSCELTKPTNVRDMDAVLYDAICSSEGESYTQRVMMMPHDTGVYLIGDGYVVEWQNCP